MPARSDLVGLFSSYYFGGDPEGDPTSWSGFIGDEPLLVDRAFFDELTRHQIRWGFVSGAEPPSARYVLEHRLGLSNPPLIAMGDAPDKPDPTGLIRLAERLTAGEVPRSIAYLGDTVADVQTVLNARKRRPELPWRSLAVAPPHITDVSAYHRQLQEAGADRIVGATQELLPMLLNDLTP